ncbi:hypothetical protein FGIG_10116, partial [Fasciola gigantica]
ELYDFNSATVGKFRCGGQLGRKKWERTFNVVEGPETIIYRPKCHTITWDIRSAHQGRSVKQQDAGIFACLNQNGAPVKRFWVVVLIVDLIGSVKFGDSYLSYHPRMNVIGTDDRVNLQQELVNYLHKIRRDWQLQDEFPMGINLIEVHPIMHEVILRVAVGNDHIKTFGFAGIKDRVIKLTESLFYDNGTHGMSYRFRKYSTGKQIRLISKASFQPTVSAYQIAFIGGKLIEGVKKYSYGAQFEDPRREAYRDLNRTVCTHGRAILIEHRYVYTELEHRFEKMGARRRQILNMSGLLYCLWHRFGLGGGNSTVHFFNHHLVRADIGADENAMLNEIASWLARVETKIGITEYKPRVFKSSVKALGKVYENNMPLKHVAEFNDPKSSEFAILKQQLTAYASELNLFHVSPSRNNREPIQLILYIFPPSNPNYQTVLIYTLELKQYIPVNPKSLHKLCKNISVRIIDKKKSEYLARECNVLDFDLEDSTITVSVKLFSDHVQYYGVDSDDLEVVWTE